jgi:acyl-CoA reductase-like NAD-dependent aldehyde dehydrogenase
MIEVVDAFDRKPITQLESDDAAALDDKIEAAQRLFADRSGWLKPHQRIEILSKLAGLMEGKREHLACQIALEGGKPFTDALIETDRAIDGVRNAADELRVMAGREIPMGLTPASIDISQRGEWHGWTVSGDEPLIRASRLAGPMRGADPAKFSTRAQGKGGTLCLITTTSLSVVVLPAV